MSIHVNTIDRSLPIDNASKTFREATGWHVDELGYLHVTKAGNGNLATYHANQWVSVERVEDGK
jgi:hypothetical protein